MNICRLSRQTQHQCSVAGLQEVVNAKQYSWGVAVNRQGQPMPSS